MSELTPEERYPEHTKMLLITDQSQAIGEFLDRGEYVLAEWVTCPEYHEDGDECSQGTHLVPTPRSIDQILAVHFDIDLDKIEAEKRAMLAEMRGSDAPGRHGDVT